MLKLLYFASLVDQLGKDAEEVELPAEVSDIAARLAWLRRRGGPWERLTEDRVRITVDRQFAAAQISLERAREIAIIPTRPI